MITSKYRTHTCGELTKTAIGQEVILSGWVNVLRDHGGVTFIDLRDHYGITQIVVDALKFVIPKEIISQLSSEYVIKVSGIVSARENSISRSTLITGEIEVIAKDIEILSISLTPPFPVNDDDININEEIRLKYRFLDLRRKKLHDNIILRSKLITWIRAKMISMGFNEFQTPILTASSPEGARDFVVPSRLHPGKFYALPQAPQQFKQLLMIAGFDRYFQIAPCFRDEDARADRSPGDFYQLDIEMSFVEQEDIMKIIEPLMFELFSKFSDLKVAESPFPRITYKDAMLYYGSDKPDLRNPLRNSDVTKIFAESGFAIFANSIKEGAEVRAVKAPVSARQPRSFFENTVKFAQSNGALGLGYITFEENGDAKGPIVKFLDDNKLNQLKQVCQAQNGDTLFFSCDVIDKVNKLSGLLRNYIAKTLNLYENNTLRLCWITDFPYFEINEEKKSLDFGHNPFSMPKGGFEALKTDDQKELLEITSYQYDLVCNGIELSSGAIRNHLKNIMYRAFEITGYNKDEVDNNFGAIIKAFDYGPPPHGGIAPGIDRILMILLQSENIRDVIAFPLNGRGEDLMMGAPNLIPDKAFKELKLMNINKFNK